MIAEDKRAPILPDYDKGELDVPHLGVTLRSLLAAAGEASKHKKGSKPKLVWTLRYKTADIGRIKIKGF